MAYSFQVTVASGSTPNVAVPFGFLDRSHVHVSLDGVQVDDATLTWLSDSQIQLASTPAASTSIKVYRSTPADAIDVQFANPDVLDANDTNLALKQLLYVTQEAFDFGQANADDLAAITDYVNNAMAQAADSAQAAADSAEAAHTSEVNAATSETNAANYAAILQAYATGTMVLIGGWDASSGAFPPTGATPNTSPVKLGWFYKVTVAGTVDGQQFDVGDAMYALKDTPSTSTYANNWLRVEGVVTAAQILAALGYTPVNPTRAINTSGLATGGGNLTADRTINVPKAAASDVTTGTDDTKAITSLARAGAAAVGSDVTAGTSTAKHVTPKALADSANAASGYVRVGSDGKLPAIDASKLTNLPNQYTAPTSGALPVGSYALMAYTAAGTVANGVTTAGSNLRLAWAPGGTLTSTGTAQVGTWVNITGLTLNSGDYGYWVRTA